MDIFFGILGRTALRIDGDLDESWGSTRLRAMLATLLVHAGRSVPIDTLVAWIWPEEGTTPQSPVATFYTYATRIRTALRRLPKPPTLHVENGSYRLDVDKSLIDYGRFRMLIGRARGYARAAAYQEAVEYAEQALALWRGRALDDLKTEPAHAWRTRVLWDEWMPANVIHIEALLQLGEFGESLTRLDELKTEYDRDVTLAKLRLSALYGLSRYVEATAYYLSMRRLLLDEVDEQAAEDLREHHESLRMESKRADAPTVSAPMIIPRQLPRDINEFVGRDDLLDALDEATRGDDAGDSSRLVTIDGMAGVGKTALAVHWGHRVRHRYPGGDFFVDLQGFSDSVNIAKSTVVDEFLIALGGLPGADLSPRAKELVLKRLLADRQALVMLDNARNTAHVKDIVELLPNCTIVVTSRLQLTTLRDAQRVHVDPMSAAEAKGLLSARLGYVSGIDQQAQEDLVALCGKLPLVITVLAQHIASRPRVHVEEFIRQLDRRQLLTDIGEDGDGSTTAETMFYWSYRALSDEEQRLFRLLALNPGPDISEMAACACDGRAGPEVKRSLRVLVAAHLLGQPEAFDRYRFHDLIREFAARRVELDEPSAELAKAESRLIDHYLTVATQAHRTLYPGNLIMHEVADGASGSIAFADGELAKAWFERERANIVAVVRFASRRDHHDQAWLLADSVETFLDRQGYYEDSRAVRELAVASARAAGDVVRAASSLVGLGIDQMILGEYVNARGSLQTALDIVDAVGFERGQASALYQLGRLELTLGNPREAVKYYKRCLKIARDIKDDEALCWTLARLAESERLLGQYGQALAHLDESQACAQRIGEKLAEVNSMVEKGSIYRDRGQYEDAAARCQRALEIIDTMSTADLAIKISTLVTLAEICGKQGDVKAANNHIHEAIKLARSIRNVTAEARALEVSGDIQFAAGMPEMATADWRLAIRCHERIGNEGGVDSLRKKIV